MAKTKPAKEDGVQASKEVSLGRSKLWPVLIFLLILLIVAELFLIAFQVFRQPEPVFPEELVEQILPPSFSPGSQGATSEKETVVEPDRDAQRDMALDHWSRCLQFRAKHDLQAAEKSCLEAVKADPLFYHPRLGLARIWFELGKNESALEAARKARKLATFSGDQDAAALLESAILTVMRQTDNALDILQNLPRPQAKSLEVQARIALLKKEPPPKSWFQDVVSRHFCYRQQSETDAEAFILRSGFLSVKDFITILDAMHPEARADLNEYGLMNCPWQ